MSWSILMRQKGANLGSIPKAATQFILRMHMDAAGVTGSRAGPGPEVFASSNVQKRRWIPDCRGRFHRDAPKILCSSAQPASQTSQKEHQQ